MNLNRLIFIISFVALALAAGQVPAQFLMQTAPLPPQVVFPANGSRGVPFVNLEIDWNPPSPDSAPVDEYVIYLSPADESLVEIGRVPASQTSYTVDFELENDSDYRFRVNSSNSFGESTNQTALIFTTEAVQSPVGVYYHIDQVVDDEVYMVVDLRNNPDGAFPQIYSFWLEWDDTILTDYELIQVGGFSDISGLTRVPVMAITPSDTSTPGDFPPNRKLITGNAFANTITEGFMFMVKFRVIGELSAGNIPFTLIDTPGVDAGIVTANNNPVDHIFVRSLYIPAPGAPSLVSPETGLTDVEGNLDLSWKDSNFARFYDIYVWPLGGTQGSPIASGDLMDFRSRPNRDHKYTLDTGPLLEGTTYLWQVVARNRTATLGSEIRTFRMFGEPTATPTPTATPEVTPTETPTPTVTPPPTTASPTATPTGTVPVTATPTPDVTPSPTGQPTVTPEVTPSPSPTAIPSPTHSATPTPTSPPGRILDWLLGIETSTPVDANSDGVLDVGDLIQTQ